MTQSMSQSTPPTEPTAAERTEWEAATFRRLIAHLDERTDVQNIDMMNLTGFCRNCLSHWYREAAEARGTPLSDHDARVAVYGMPYPEWKARYQTDATDGQKAEFNEAIKQHS